MDDRHEDPVQRFRALHDRDGPFVIANAWDAGSARALARMGYEALGTSSAGLAFTLGLPDGSGRVSRETVLVNARRIMEAGRLPVTVDLESGYAHTPEGVAETIGMTVDIGAAGGSIEDATGDPDHPVFDVGEAVARLQAARNAIDARGSAFVLTARAEGFRPDDPDALKAIIDRLCRYHEAGGDCLYAPGLRTREEIATVRRHVPGPLNVVMGLTASDLTLADLAELGVKRVSVGSAFARAGWGAFLAAAAEVHDHGTFGFAAAAAPFARVNGMFEES